MNWGAAIRATEKRPLSCHREGAALALGALLVMGASGCRARDELYPLKVGNEWSYNVRGGLAQFVEPLKVTKEISTAGVRGFEVAGPMGASRLAWKDGTLVASAMPNMRVAEGSSGIPLVVEGVRKVQRSWEGQVEFLGRTQAATAILVQEPEALSLGGKRYDTIKTNLQLKMPQRTVELITWFARGIGPVRQEQRTNGAWDVGLEYLGGP